MINGNSDYHPGYIEKKLASGDALLWVVWEDKKISAAATTEICSVVDRDRILVITSFGGSMPEQWAMFLEQLEQYAKDEKCTRIRGYGRPGWSRFLKNYGYKQPWIVFEKRVQ